MLGDAHASDGAIKVDADYHGDIAAVTIWGKGGNNGGYGLAITAGNMNVTAFFES